MHRINGSRPTGRDAGLLNDFVQDIAMDSRNTMWFANYDIYTQEGGISRMRGTVWNTYGVANGLVAAHVKRIAADHLDNIWITTGSGVSKVYDIYLGTGERDALAAKIYPNPATDKIHIDRLDSGGEFQLMTIAGKILISQTLSKGGNTISLEGCSTGLYIIKFKTSEGCETGKLIIR